MCTTVPVEGDVLTETKTPRIVDKPLSQTVSEGDIATFECRFSSPVQPQVSSTSGLPHICRVMFRFSRISV